MTIKQAIEKAIEGGYPNPYFLGNIPLEKWEGLTASIFLDPAFWQSLGNAMGWEHTDKRWCHMKPSKIYKLEIRDGIIVGESRDKTSWWVQWNGIGSRYKYLKDAIKEEEIGLDWEEHWHEFISCLAAGKKAEDFFDPL